MKVLEQIAEIVNREIPEIPSERQYWLVRTNSGKLYEKYTEGDFVGIDYDKISLTQVKSVLQEKTSIEELKKLLKKNYELKDSNLSIAAHQIKRFCTEISPNDIVVIPSKSSSYYNIGIVQDKCYEIEANRITKRIPVKWIKQVNKLDLPVTLKNFAGGQSAVVSLRNSAKQIDNLLYSIYIKNGEYYFNLDVQNKSDLKAFAVFKFGSIFLQNSALGQFNEEDIIENVELEINLNSPGQINFSTKAFWLLVGMVVTVSFIGGKVPMLPSSYETDGLLNNALDWYKEYNRHDEVEKMLRLNEKHLQIKPFDTLNPSYPEVIKMPLINPNRNLDKSGNNDKFNT